MLRDCLSREHESTITVKKDAQNLPDVVLFQTLREVENAIFIVDAHNRYLLIIRNHIDRGMV